MSIDDDRPRRTGDYSNTGYSRGAEPYPGSGGYSARSEQHDPGFVGLDDSEYSTDQPTTMLPGASPYDAMTEEEPPAARRPAVRWHAGADLGLLALRLALGGLFLAHGLRTLFGVFGGGGIEDAAATMTAFGYSNATLLAWVTGVCELAGGTLILLGLFTPAGAAMILGVMANVIIAGFDSNRFVGGVELEWIYAASAFALLFAGPGRVSLDRPTPWYRHAPAFGAVFLVLAAGATVTTLLVFR